MPGPETLTFTDTKGRSIEAPADQVRLERCPKGGWYVVMKVGSHWVTDAEADRIARALAPPASEETHRRGFADMRGRVT